MIYCVITWSYHPSLYLCLLKGIRKNSWCVKPPISTPLGFHFLFLLWKLKKILRKFYISLKFELSYGRKIKKVLRKILLIRSLNFKKVFINKWKANFLIKKKRVCHVLYYFAEIFLILWVLLYLLAIFLPSKYMTISKRRKKNRDFFFSSYLYVLYSSEYLSNHFYVVRNKWKVPINNK